MLNEPTKTCIVQSFILSGDALGDVIQEVDCEVRDFINEHQLDWWYIQNIQHEVFPNRLGGTYIVHLVMSRMHDYEPTQY